jgi:hypothetical protein
MKLLATDEKQQNEFWPLIIQRCDSMMSSNEAAVDFRSLKGWTNDMFALIVFDEAMSLVDASSDPIMLNHVRKGLLYPAAEGIKLMGILLDTNSSINNLYPQDVKRLITPSERPLEYENAAEFHALETYLKGISLPPYYTFPLCNWEVPTFMPKETFHYEDLDVKAVFYHLRSALKSRPLFASQVRNHFNTSTLEDLGSFREKMLIFAKNKLIFDTKYNSLELKSSSSQSEYMNSIHCLAKFAVVSSRYYLHSTIGINLNLLVKQFMGTCTGVDAAMGAITMEYVSEPLLAEVASQLILMQNPPVFLNVMNQLNELMFRGMLRSSGGKGGIGKLIASIVLSRAFDMASIGLIDQLYRAQKVEKESETSMQLEEIRTNSTTYSYEPYRNSYDFTFGKQELCRPIPLLYVLKILYKSANDGQVDELFEHHLLLRKAIVMYNHFIKVEYQVEVTDLDRYLQQGAAIMCMDGEAGIDMIIPLALPKEDNKAIDIWDSSTFVISAWFVQIKNWNSSMNAERLAREIIVSNPFQSVMDHLRRNISFSSGATSSSRSSHGKSKKKNISTSDESPYPVVVMAMNIGPYSSSKGLNYGIGTRFSFTEEDMQSKPKKRDIVPSSSSTEQGLGKSSSKKRKYATPTSQQSTLLSSDAFNSIVLLQFCGLDAIPGCDEATTDAIQNLRKHEERGLLIDYHRNFRNTPLESCKSIETTFSYLKKRQNE